MVLGRPACLTQFHGMPRLCEFLIIPMRRLCALWAGAVVFFGLSTARAEQVPINGLRAVVHDSVITEQDVRQMTAPAYRQWQRDYAGQDEVIRKKLAQAEQENLEQLVQRQLILQDF